MIVRPCPIRTLEFEIAQIVEWCYNSNVAQLRPCKWEGGESMTGEILNFFLAVGASVIGYYICKWLDRPRRGS